MKGLRESLDRYGLLDVIVVNVADGKKTIVSGHQRCKALLADGITHADCACVSFDPVVEKMANLAMNNPAIQGVWDPAKGLPALDRIVGKLPTPDFAGFERLRDELKKEAARATRGAATDTPAPTTNGAKPAKSKPGVMYHLGRHVLFSGPAHGLLNGFDGAGTSVVTSLPLGLGEVSMGELFEDVLKVVTGACYVFTTVQEVPSVEVQWKGAKGTVHRWLVWAKDRPSAQGKGDYRSQYEMVLYGYRVGATPAPPRARPNVFEYAATKDGSKPVALIAAVMESCDGAVIDPCAGDGTVLVVAESMGRVCYAAESDLHRVDAIRQRWAVAVHGPEAKWEKLTTVGRK
jgi:hypothetical protein